MILHKLYQFVSILSIIVLLMMFRIGFDFQNHSDVKFKQKPKRSNNAGLQ